MYSDRAIYTNIMRRFIIRSTITILILIYCSEVLYKRGLATDIIFVASVFHNTVNTTHFESISIYIYEYCLCSEPINIVQTDFELSTIYDQATIYISQQIVNYLII